MDERTKRTALIVGAIVLALLAIGSGAMIALSSDNERAESPSPTPNVTTTDEPSVEPTESSEPSESGSPEPAECPILEDGNHFVYVTSASRLEDGTSEAEFDLAYFYTDARAEQEAAERGDEFVNDYYIVNDNPRLRTLPLADEVEVQYVLDSQCCELQPWDVDSWLEAIGLSTNPSDYPGTNVPWWFTVEGCQITTIEQQYLP